MAGFRFSLEQVLGWRRTQLELAEACYKREFAALEKIDGQLAGCEASGARAETQVRAWRGVTGGELEALGAFRLRLKAEKVTLVRRRDAQVKELAAREAAMLEARRRCRLLERLKERCAAEWLSGENHALEEAASESFLAKWSRGMGVRHKRGDAARTFADREGRGR